MQVLEIDEGGGEKTEVYFSSSCVESAQRTCIKTEVWERVGYAVLHAIEDGRPMSVDEIKDASIREEMAARTMSGEGTEESNHANGRER